MSLGPGMNCSTFLGLFLEQLENRLGMILRQLAADWEDLNESKDERKGKAR